jgi:hypothetical protein
MIRARSRDEIGQLRRYVSGRVDAELPHEGGIARRLEKAGRIDLDVALDHL